MNVCVCVFVDRMQFILLVICVCAYVCVSVLAYVCDYVLSRSIKTVY